MVTYIFHEKTWSRTFPNLRKSSKSGNPPPPATDGRPSGVIWRLGRGREWSRAARGGSRAAAEAAGHRPHVPGTPQAPPGPRGTAHSTPAPPQAPPSKNLFFFLRYVHRAWPNLRSGLSCTTSGDMFQKRPPPLLAETSILKGGVFFEKHFRPPLAAKSKGGTL